MFIFENGRPGPESSYFGLSEAEIEQFLAVHRYGDFELTEAVRPSYDLKVTPEEGYRYDVYRDRERNFSAPSLIASVTRQKLFEVFLDLLDLLQSPVDVVLETSYRSHSKKHTDHYRKHIDLPVMKSILWDYEDLLCNDGRTGIAVLSPTLSREVQLDEHKLLTVYTNRFGPFEDVMEQHRIQFRAQLRFMMEVEHLHSSSEEYWHAFHELKTRLGIDHQSEEDQATC